MAAMAEHEREMISRRTKDALQAAKARGQVLGKPENLKNRATGTQRANLTRSKMATEFAQRMQGVIEGYKGLTLTAIAEKLNEAGELTATGKGRWTAAGVRAVIKRIGG
jgi:DNA invertase Pin-like site-specific DNA recombinase